MWFDTHKLLSNLQRGFGAIRNLALNHENQSNFGRSAIMLVLEVHTLHIFALCFARDRSQYLDSGIHR